jgi:hypothetical protein
MNAQTDTVRRVLALFNELPADQKARGEHPALAQLLAPGSLYTFRDGVIVQIQAFFDQEDARRAVDAV